MPSEQDRKNARELLSGRYSAAARESERAGGSSISMPGGAIRMPNKEEAAQIGLEALPALAGQTIASKLAGPLASRFVAPAVRAAIRGGAGVLGGAAGGAGSAALFGRPVVEGAATGAVGAAAGEALGMPFGPTQRSLVERVTEPIGAGVRAVGRRIPGVSKLFEMAPGADEAIRLLAEQGDGRMPTLGQVSQSNSVIWAEAMAQRAIGSHGVLAGVQEGAEANAKGLADSFVKRFMDVDRVEAGTLIDDVLKNRAANFRDAASAMYAPVDKALGGEAVPTQKLKDAAEKLLATRVGIKGGAAKSLLDAIAELPENISFSKASAIRSDLLRINRASDELVKGQAGGIATDLHGVIDSEMEAAAKRLDPKLASAWREAQAFYKRGAQDFNDDIIGALARKEPEEMADYLFNLNEGTVRRSAIERLRRVASNYGEGQFGESDILEPLRGAFIKKIFKGAASGEGAYGEGSVQFLNGKSLRQTLARFDKSELETLFNSSDAQKLGAIARTVELTQKRAKNEISTAGVPSIVLLQGGTTVAIWNSDQSLPAKSAETGAVWVLGPRALSWALRDPKTVKLLASNVPTGPPGGGVISKLAAQFTARMLTAQRMFGGDEVRSQRGTMRDQPMDLRDPSRRATTFEETQ